MGIKPRIILFLYLLTVYSTVYSQTDTLMNRDIKALQNYAALHPTEKVHLHLDRQIYVPGDTIWFKAYVMIGERHQLSVLSGVLYAELINEKDSLLTRLTLELRSGLGNGEFVLPLKCNAGVYRVRAYTNWMRNAGPDYYCDEKIIVAGFTPTGATNNAVIKPKADSSIKVTPAVIDVQFFPEGGDLVNGIRSEVAFKAINSLGLGEEVKGAIVDSAGTQIATFNTGHAGMGRFFLKPRKGTAYRARITGSDGSSRLFDLPPVKKSGLTLSVSNNSPDSIYVKIDASEELYKSKTDTAFYLIAQAGGKFCLSATDKIGRFAYHAEIPKKIFPTGIVKFTLFSQSGEPLCERIIFVQHNDQLKLGLSADRDTYAPGDAVSLNLDAKNDSDKRITAAFSLSVTDVSKIPADEENENTIFTDLLLRSELTGNIEKPNYYFINPNDKTRADLDLLMLTQGYHRFEWKQVLDGKPPEITYQPEKFMQLNGVVKTLDGKPIPGVKISLASINQMMVEDTLSDAAGKFQFNKLAVVDSSKLYLRIAKGGKARIEITKPVYELVNNVSRIDTAAFMLSADIAGQLKAQLDAYQPKSGIVLKQVDIKSTNNPMHNYIVTHSANLNGPGAADQVIAGDKFLNCDHLVYCLQSLIRGGVRWVADVAYSTHTPDELIPTTTKPMMVMVDGSILPQSTAFAELNPNDIASVEILSSHSYTSIYGADAFGGIILITTRRGDEAKAPPAVTRPGLTIYTFNGFYKAREFYSPRYDIQNSARIADDKRRTIYWDPDIIIHKDDKVSFNYFNAGGKGDYRVVIEGIDLDGKIGRQVLYYKVRQGE